MAVFRICDWSKRRLTKDEETYTLTVNGNEYEVCLESMQDIIRQLESEDAPVVTNPPVASLRPATAQRPTPAPQPPQAIVPADDIGLNVESPEPFDGAEIVQIAAPVAPIAIPASTKERLPLPTIAQGDVVIAESKRFPMGTLSSLTPGKQRNLAAKKLADKEQLQEDRVKKQKEALQ